MLAEEHYDHDSSRYEENQVACVEGIVDAVRRGIIPREVIDGAVSRILLLKKAHGLLGLPRLALDAAVMGSAAHRAVETQAAEGSSSACVTAPVCGRSPMAPWPSCRRHPALVRHPYRDPRHRAQSGGTCGGRIHARIPAGTS